MVRFMAFVTKRAYKFRVRKVYNLALNAAYSNFFAKRARHPRFKSKRRSRAQKDLARKQKGSANRHKARVRVARIHARHIADASWREFRTHLEYKAA